MQDTLGILADPQRRRIVELLRDRPRTPNELVTELQLSQPGTSRHLRILREGGLVTSQSQAQQRIYSLRPEPFEELASWLQDIRQLWASQLDALGN
ncbi:DNA-binding transcriptional ArsR family regulator [Psychromicrobium silvestre]|uniref:DNA-binding transcriptional ArsR family regulator n=1 Tax=Psychromicrobium silvestre TaxID=1645614 RepID=A0A7Y9S736_9MICC|nr:metalloregulator ArsR/SmtB family transcription factor [Psychromicrobium silvestre]NYE95839.1 DNA-binding transcriptional ArsR family regulator [Psychromicrobium silvestre]